MVDADAFRSRLCIGDNRGRTRIDKTEAETNECAEAIATDAIATNRVVVGVGQLKQLGIHQSMTPAIGTCQSHRAAVMGR